MNHPAVTAPIVGPRTMEHPESPLPAAGVVLDPALLDTINPAGTDAVSQNTDGRGVTPNGRVILYIGSSVRDIRLTDTVTLSSGTCAQDSDAEGGDGAGGSDGGGRWRQPGLSRAARAVGRIYSIGVGSRVSLNRTLDVRHQEREAGDVLHTGADIEHARADPGYAPTTGLEAGLRAELAWVADRARRIA